MKSQNKDIPTRSVLEKMIQDADAKIKEIFYNTSGYGVSLADIIDHPETIENPNLLKLISSLQSICSIPFHVSGKNFMHNHEYRDLLCSTNYDEQKPWVKEKRKKKVHGIDDLGDTRPSTEYKSICMPKNKTKLYLNDKTIIGVVDKLNTRNEYDEIYGPLSDKALCANIFDSKGNKILVSFYINKEEFGRVVSEALKNAKIAYKEKTGGYEKKGRDSINLTIGMFLGCKSFKVFYVAESDIEIISEIQPQDNIEFYNSISSFLGDKEKELKNISNAKTTDKLIYTYANKKEKKLDICNFTTVELNFSKMVENKNEQNLDLICGHYYSNNIIYVIKIPNDQWLPLFNEQYEFSLVRQKMLSNGSTELQIKEYMESNNMNLQSSIIKSNTFRLNSSVFKNFELLYINEDYIDNFVTKKSKNEILNLQYKKIEMFKLSLT